MTALCKQAHNENDPLSVFVAKAGGINPEYAQDMRAGELRRIRELGRGLPPGAINRKATLTLEEMAERAQEEGFTTDADLDLFLDALEKDVNASACGQHTDRVYRLYSQAAVAAWEAQYEDWGMEQEESSANEETDDCPFDVPQEDVVEESASLQPSTALPHVLFHTACVFGTLFPCPPLKTGNSAPSKNVSCKNTWWILTQRKPLSVRDTQRGQQIKLANKTCQNMVLPWQSRAP